MEGMDRTNHGMILSGSPAPTPDTPYTVIVSGVARSGTSMVATILHTAGMMMGDPPLPVVLEDQEILTAVQSGQEAPLRRVIDRRNAAHPVWGFKLPNLVAYLHADRIAWFRNPRLILIFRDPVAVAVRDSLSEYFDPRETVRSSMHGMLTTLSFAERSGCPTLMLSYEKAITSPHRTVRAVLGFAGISVPEAMLEEIARTVVPDNPLYLATANSQFVGYVDGIAQGFLIGWCRHIDVPGPVELELFANDTSLTTFVANQFRADLAQNRIGNGNHAFHVDMRGFNLAPDTVIRVRPRRRSIELSNSGRTVEQLAMRQQIAEQPPLLRPVPAPAAAPDRAAAPSPPSPASPPKASLGSW